MLAGYESGDLVVWDWSNNTQLTTVNMSSRVGTLMTCVWDWSRDRGAVLGSEDNVVVFDETLTLVKERRVTNKGLSEAVIRDDHKILITAGWDARLRLFSWIKPDKLKPLAVLQYQKQSVETISTQDNMIVAGSKDGRISVWRIY